MNELNKIKFVTHNNELVANIRDIDAQDKIIEINTEIETINSNVSNLASRVTTNESNISNLESRVTTNESNISNLESRVTTNESNISTNSDKIETLSKGGVKYLNDTKRIKFYIGE